MVEDSFLARDETKPQSFAKLWDQPQPGFVPIQITPQEHNRSSHFYKYPVGVDATISDALRSLNYPEQQSTNTIGKLLIREIEDCSKLSFLLATLRNIGQRSCNLDLAIIGSSKGIERLLTDALSLYEHFEFQSMSMQYGLDNPPVHGVLVKFRKNSKPTPTFRMSVDYIIEYDAAVMDSRLYISLFQGVYYDKPVILSLVCLRCPDVRVCNYKNQYRNQINGNVSLKKAPFEIAALFYNVSYSKVKVSTRKTLNEEMSIRLVSWMILKDGSKFDPGCSAYTNRIRQLEYAALVASAPAGVKRSASALNGSIGPSTLPKRRALGSSKSFGINKPISLSPETLRLIKARIRSSFPTRELKNSTLVLDEEVVRALGWLASTKIICSDRPNSNIKPRMDSSSSFKEGGNRIHGFPTHSPISNIPMASTPMSQQSYPPVSSSNIPRQSGTPTIHPSRLAIMQGSNSQPPVQEPLHTNNDNTSVDHHPSSTQENGKDPNTMSVSATAPTEPTKPTEPTSSTSPTSFMSDEKSPENDDPSEERKSSADGLNDFEVALERAHLELMRSLMGTGQEGGNTEGGNTEGGN